MCHSKGSFGFVQRRLQIVVAAFWIDPREIVLYESRDTLAVSIECIGDDGKFGCNRGQIDGRHDGTLCRDVSFTTCRTGHFDDVTSRNGATPAVRRSQRTSDEPSR